MPPVFSKRPLEAASPAPVCVILLNYDGGEMLKRCINSFAIQSQLPAKVIFVDNGSSSYDELAIRASFGSPYASALEFLRIEQNVGYVKAMNRGLQSGLRNPSVPWLMTLSNDTELDPCFFENLGITLKNHAALPSGMVGMLGPKIKSRQPPHLLDGAGIGLSLDGMSTARGQRELDRNQYDGETSILIPNGVSALYNKALLEDVGLLDESFWAYCEDTDLGLRAWLAGWDCRFLPECIVYHSRSSTHGEHSLSKLYQVERNHYWVAIKNLPLLFLILNPLFSLFRYGVQAYALLSKRGQGKGFGESHPLSDLAITTMKGVLDAWLGAWSAFHQRLRLRHLRRRPTTEIMLTLWKNRLRFGELILK